MYHHAAIMLTVLLYKKCGKKWEWEICNVIANNAGVLTRFVTPELQICGVISPDRPLGKGAYLDQENRLVVNITTYDSPGSAGLHLQERTLEKIAADIKELLPRCKLDLRSTSPHGNFRIYEP